MGAALALLTPGRDARAASGAMVRARVSVPVLAGAVFSPVAPVLSAPKSFSLAVPSLSVALTPVLAPTAVPLAAPSVVAALPIVSVTAALQPLLPQVAQGVSPVTASAQLSVVETSAGQAAAQFDGAAPGPGGGPPVSAQAAGSGKVLRLLITGPPGSGKGTYAQKIAKDYGVLHISAGELLRVKAKSDPVLAAIMNRGDLVPAEVVIAAVKERLAQPDVRERGYILDGFPRRLVEAREFKAMLAQGEALDGAIHLDVPEAELLRRILSRGRADDTEAVFHNRMKVYRSETKPAIKEAVRGVPVLKPDVRGPDIETNYAKVKAMLEALWAGLR